MGKPGNGAEIYEVSYLSRQSQVPYINTRLGKVRIEYITYNCIS